MAVYVRWVTVCVLVASALAASCVRVGEAAEWESLFEGKHLGGWTQRGGQAKYKAVDGVIVGTTVPDTPNSFLCADRLFGDFILELEFKVDPGLNSGIQIRSESHRAYRDGRVHGYQVEIDPSERAYSGGIYDEARRGWLCDLSDNEAARKAIKRDEWNHFRIEAVGDSIKTWLNGVPAADLIDSMTPIGFIGLQVHQIDDEKPLRVRWRNIRIKDLDGPPAREATDDPYMGDWSGTKTGGPSRIVAQVVAMGWGKYQAVLLPEFDTRATPIMVMNGRLAEDGNRVLFRSSAWSGEIASDSFIGGKEGDEPWAFEMKKLTRLSPTLGAEPPAGAVVLFDGTNLNGWQKAKGGPAGWKLVEGGAMEVAPRSGSIVTRRKFSDVKLHVEFRTPFVPRARGQGRGNSGVYLQARYEVQVLDSYGLEGLDNECGGVYRVAAPRVNMCAPPLHWQTYDITFRAARFDDDGRKVENARMTLQHNGVVIHDELELPRPTGGRASRTESPEADVLYLQNHGNPVQYRNIWAVELD